ncbi:MAG: hypothetical protein NVSMB52_08330 [Chloroflexota bacterium]
MQIAVLLSLLLLFVLPEMIEVLDGPDTIVTSLLRHSALFIPFILLAAEEAGVPLPVPGDVIIAYIGFRAFQGAIPYPVAFIGFLVAILLGASLLYWLSSRWGQALVRKLGRFMHISDERLQAAERRFRTHGAWFIIVGRHIPGLRVPITVFCGISEVRYRLFMVSTFVSVVFWIGFWLVLGARLGPKTVHLLHGGHWYTVLIPALILLVAVLLIRKVMQFRTTRTAHTVH